MSEQIIFGAGSLWRKETVATNPASAKIATLKELSLEVSEDEAEQYGASKFPIHVAPTKGKAGGKLVVASYEPALAAGVMAGATVSTGYEAMADDEEHVVPSPSGPYTVVVTHAADYNEDYGVRYASSGLSLLRVTSAPTTGQYSVNEATGTYTFAAADAAKAMWFSYSYDVVGTGQTIDVKNVPMGTGAVYTLFGWNEFEGRKFGYKFPTARVKGMSLGFKADAHVSPEHQFTAYAQPGQTVYKLFVA